LNLNHHLAQLDYMDTQDNTVPKRSFPPLYQGTGVEAQDRLAFIHVLERLKVLIDSKFVIVISIEANNRSRHRSGQDGSTTKSVLETFNE